MVRRTTINLDSDLVAQAREVIRRERLKRLGEWDLGGKTLEDMMELRRSRVETRPWGRTDGQ
jgi:hypothetical protein